MWLTVISPNPPVIMADLQQLEFQWGQNNASLSWEVHGGTHWTLWKNGTAAYDGTITSKWIEVRIENWEPGTYNLTLQVIDEDNTATTSTTWIRIWVDLGDAYADSIITGTSMWYLNGENALGPPDGKFTRLYIGYGNGHVTLDMGRDEEVRNGAGTDFTVYARGGEYVVFVGNNLSIPTLVGNQVPPPLILLGEGLGNTSFDLTNVGLDQVRYIQVVYLSDEDVELDSVEALYFNQPPRPKSTLNRWMFPVFGSVFTFIAMFVLWMQKRKR